MSTKLPHALVRLAVAGLMAIGGAPSVAVAAEPGVFVDPDSPAGKEYAIPLDSVRRDAAGGSGSGSGSTSAGGSSSGDAALFGTGISSVGTSGASGSGGSDDSRGGSSGGGSGEGSDKAALAAANASDGSSAATQAGGVALAVLLVGGGLGLLLRRTLRS